MKTIKHKFVEFVPENLEFGVIYISIKYKTAVHSCICGCGNKVITPLTPTDWRLTFNGQSVSLYPSIGNWNFDCKSHFGLRRTKLDMLIYGMTMKSKMEEIWIKRKKRNIIGRKSGLAYSNFSCIKSSK